VFPHVTSRISSNSAEAGRPRGKGGNLSRQGMKSGKKKTKKERHSRSKGKSTKEQGSVPSLEKPSDSPKGGKGRKKNSLDDEFDCAARTRGNSRRAFSTSRGGRETPRSLRKSRRS